MTFEQFVKENFNAVTQFDFECYKKIWDKAYSIGISKGKEEGFNEGYNEGIYVGRGGF